MSRACSELRALTAGLLALVGGSAAAQTIATKPEPAVPAECELSQSARVVTTLKSLPEVSAEFDRLGIDIADKDEPFIPFDFENEASRGLPHRQFQRAYVFSDRVVVWYFHGGFGTHFHVIELQLRQDPYEREPVLRITGRNLGGPLCLATQALLDKVMGASEW